MNDNIIRIVEEKLNCKVKNTLVLGNGASGTVSKVEIDCEPYELAIKSSHCLELLKKEYDNIRFISSKVNCKLPNLYFYEVYEDIAIMVMEYIEGVEPNSKNLFLKKNKQKLANEIIDNLITIQTVHNDKYGYIDNAIYDTWYDFYSEFAKGIVDFTNKSDVPNIVKDAVNKSYDALYKIVGEIEGKPTIIHGDYWIPNFIVDTKLMSLKGVLDPFNIMWAEPEYELFALTVGYGKKMHLYETYKSKVKTSKYCDIKIELYSLYNELLWYKNLGKIDFHYLEYRSKNLLNMLNNV